MKKRITNMLRGTIAYALLSMAIHQTHSLQANELRDAVTSSAALTQLTLEINKLSGAIPSAVTSLANLTHLHLYLNSLNGSIPDALASFATLTHLSLGRNKLRGAIPDGVTSLTDLICLDLNRNALRGAIPDAAVAASCATLADLSLSGNFLSGTVPDGVTSLAGLIRLDLSINALLWIIPNAVASLAKLINFALDTNELHGAIPDAVAALANLISVSLGLNKLRGAIPDAVAPFVMLTHLELANNELQGAIPNRMATLAHLSFLELYNNKLSGAIPDAVTPLANLIHLKLGGNKLRGAIPVAIAPMTALIHFHLRNNYLCGALPTAAGSLTNLVYLYLEDNKLVGAIPDAVASLADLERLHLQTNKLLGAIPDAVASSKALTQLNLRCNKLRGAIPGAAASLLNLQSLKLSANELFGSIPEAVARLTDLLYFELQNNQISGSIPGAVSPLTHLRELALNYNKLLGPVPDAMSCVVELRRLRLDSNDLRGSIPHGIFHHKFIYCVSMSSNELSGTISTIEALRSKLPFSLLARENRLTGSFPACRHSNNLQRLSCSGNMLEGTLPANMMTSGLEIMDASGQGGHVRGLVGQLPPMAKAFGLRHLLISYQNLEGFIPPLTATLSTLALHGNQFSLFQSAQWEKDGSAIVLMHMNLLTCFPPACGHVGTNFSLVALGNNMEYSRKLPDWVSPMERDIAFWRSGTEGFSLLLKVVGSTSLLGVAVAARFRSGLLLKALSTWHIGPHPHMRVARASSLLLILLAHQVLVRGLVFMFLLSWDSYKCPSSLSVASTCLRDDAFNHLLVLILWSPLCSLSKKLGHLAPSGSLVTKRNLNTALTLCVCPLCLAVALSSLSVLYQAMQSVPGFLGIGGFAGKVLKSCVGAFQGLLGGVVLSIVGKKLSDNKLSFLVMTGLFTSCILPGAVILFLDTQCAGSWPAFWDPCRTNPERFDRKLILLKGDISYVKLLSPTDICDSHHARAQTSLSKCIQAALLRLQDLWLPKIITSGVVIPACRLAMNTHHYKDSTDFVGALAVYIAYSMITAGHLPLVMPVLWMSIMSITLLAAVSLHEQYLRRRLKQQDMTSIVLLPQVVSALVHAASASGSASAFLFFSAICICRMARAALGWLAHRRRALSRLARRWVA